MGDDGGFVTGGLDEWAEHLREEGSEGSIDSPDSPPFIERETVIVHKPGGVSRKVGHVGDCIHREGKAFISKRDFEEHRIRALNAYAISVDVIEGLDERGVETVLIHEVDGRDRSTVLEFGYDSFIEAPQVPDRYLQTENDPQKYMERGAAKGIWDNGDKVYLK